MTRIDIKKKISQQYIQKQIMKKAGPLKLLKLTSSSRMKTHI